MSTISGDSPSVASARSIVEEKVAQHIDMAKAAFARKDLPAVVRLLEQVPEIQMTPDLVAIREHCRLNSVAQTQFDAASKSFASGDFEQALRLLESIPESVHNDKILDLLAQAQREVKTEPVFLEAQRRLEAFDFEEVVHLLEAIDKPERTDRVVNLLLQAHTNVRRMKELREQIEALLGQAKTQKSAAVCDQVIVLFKQLLAISPNDAEAISQLEAIGKFQEQLADRDRLYGEALACFENRDYQAALQLLRTIHDDLCVDETRELLQKTEACERERLELTETLLKALRHREFSGLPQSLERLTALVRNAVGEITAHFPGEKFELMLADLAKQASTQPELVEPLDRFVETLETGRIAAYESAPGWALIENYPETGRVLPVKLLEILNNLVEHFDVAAARIETLQRGVRLLGPDAARLGAWRDLLQSWTEFQSLVEKPFSWRECLVENPRAAQIESVGKRLAEAAANALAGTADRSEAIGRLAGERLKIGKWIERKVLRRIQAFQTTATWPERLVTPISHHMLLNGAATSVLLGLLIVGMSLLWQYLLLSGWLFGPLGFTLQSGVWVGFCWALSRLLESEVQEAAPAIARSPDAEKSSGALAATPGASNDGDELSRAAAAIASEF